MKLGNMALLNFNAYLSSWTSCCFWILSLSLRIFEELSGARLLYNYVWIGGVWNDINDSQLKRKGSRQQSRTCGSQRFAMFE